MEVIVAEYTVAGFIPVILASVSASAVSLGLADGGALLEMPEVLFSSVREIPYILLVGLSCGVAIASFIKVLDLSSRLSNWPVVIRFTLAGAVTGAMALLVPETLGLGYDTLGLIFDEQVLISGLLIVCLCKILATAISCGLGLPVGMIGPSLLIGACLGAAVGIGANTLHPGLASDYPLYIAIGMAAAMAAMLNAPLAAILAVVELTNSVSIAMPALLAVVTASLTNTGLFRQRSAHHTMLRQLQRVVPDDPLTQLLHRTDVTATMDPRVVRVPVILHADDLEPLLEFTPTWCLVEREGQDLYLVQGKDLLEWLSETLEEGGEADLAESVIRRWTIAAVPIQATLRQAMDKIRANTVEAVCVYEPSRASGKSILHGVVTRESIEKFSLERL
jgi:CIC family chloride channel protein